MKVPDYIRQDWEVFSAICPKAIMKIIKSRKMTFLHYHNIANAMSRLGFFELSMFFLIEKYDIMCKNTPDADTLTQEADLLSPKYNGSVFLEMIISNITNDKLKEYFKKQTEH